MSGEFDPDKEYGEFFTITDADAWREICLSVARRCVPPGNEITIAIKGREAAWRYPPCPELVPDDWEHELAVT